MATKLTLSGIVLDQGTEKRLTGATVRLETPTSVLFQKTDGDGKYMFKDIEEPALTEEQESYEVSLYAHTINGQQGGPVKLEIKKGTITEIEDIKIVDRGPINNGAGKVFLFFLVTALVSLMYYYYHVHNEDINNSTENVNADIVNVLTESLVERITADSVKVSGFQLKAGKIDSTDYQFILAEIQQIEGAATELYKASQVDTTIRALIDRNLEDVRQAIERLNKTELQAALFSSKSYISEVKSFNPSWFWKNSPKIYIEILYWALFATLLRLIGNTSFYISRNSFYRDSISHKVVLLFTIPLIALLISIIVSFFKISISLGDAQFVLDFSEPYIIIILASLIGLAPWKAWEFMYGLADKLFTALKSWLNLDKEGDQESEGSESDSGQPKKVEPVVPPSDEIQPNDKKEGSQEAEPDEDHQDGETIIDQQNKTEPIDNDKTEDTD